MQRQQAIRILHWSIVICVVVAYTTAYYRYWYTTQTEVVNWYLLVIHINFGILVLILTIIMLILRCCLYWCASVPKIGTKTMARVMHYILCFMLFSLPVSAYIGIGFDLPLLGIINLPAFSRFNFIQHWLEQDLGILMITFIEPFAHFHKDHGVDIILPVLLIGHVGATIFHHNLSTKKGT